jgi:hypothetical protein
VLVGPSVFVGAGVLVGGTDVFVAGTVVAVRVGIGVSCSTELGRFAPRYTFGVAVPRWTGVLDGLGVAVAVTVGVAEMRGVAVAVKVGVLDGKVDVGKGPRSASAVPRMACLVPSTLFCWSSCKPSALPLLKTSA